MVLSLAIGMSASLRRQNPERIPPPKKKKANRLRLRTEAVGTEKGIGQAPSDQYMCREG
jgi:hypothetical protein